MNLKERSQKAVRDACKALGSDLTDEQESIVVKVIQEAMVDAIRETAAESGKAALECCSHDKDMAHKISEEIKRSQTALIANLDSLR